MTRRLASVRRLGRSLRWVRLSLGAGALATAAGCSTTSIVLSVAGIATDTSVTWEIAKHIHAKMTEGDPVACFRLNSVERALATRCGSFSEGSLKVQDIGRNDLQSCELTLAARDPALWPVLPELLSKGAKPDRCSMAPLAALAHAHACPDFASASPEVRRSLVWLAENDARSVQHDVVRVLSCPSARVAGLDRVLDTWLAAGAFPKEGLGFGVLGALHPDHLQSPFARKLETLGHTAQASLVRYQGQQPPGFETALRLSHYDALQWWLNRAPQLANRVPSTQGADAGWSPLARVLLPTFLADPAKQRDTLEFLMARGADPWKPMPGGAHRSVVSYARFLQSPHVALLDPPWVEPAAAPPKRMVAQAAEAAAPPELPAR